MYKKFRVEVTSMLGKMNEHSWSYKDGKEATANQNKIMKHPFRFHDLYPRRPRWNKKYGLLEWSSKGSKHFICMRVTD